MKRLAALLPEKRITLTVLYAAGALTSALALATPAYAQLGNQTTIADPSRVREQFSDDLVVPQVSPDIDVRQMALQGAPEGSEKIIFKFGGLRIEGATVYTQGALAALYKDKIGQDISLADVYAIANEMTLKYRNDGYILTQVVVPPQTIEGGAVRLQVVEGFVDKVIVQADEKEGRHAVATIKQYARQISEGGPANVKKIERELLLINDLPGVHARSILSPSKTTKGAADLLIIVERKPYDAMLSVDNYGSRYLGPTQFSAAGTLNSLLGVNDAISAQVVLAPQIWDDNELVYGSASYEMPVGPWGAKVSVLVSRTDTEPGFDLEPFDVSGRSDFIQVKATHPFIRARSTNLYGRIMFDARNVKSENNVAPDSEDNIRALRAALRYEFLDQLLGSVAFNVADVEMSMGLHMFGASEAGDANLTRALGDPQFTKLALELQRLHRLTTNINLLLEGRGQMSADPLLSSEEFGVGGINSARGYEPSEIVGDQGVSGRIELQWKNPGNLHNNSKYLEKYQLFGFWDGGRVWNTDNVTADQKRDSLTSVGAGVRADFAAGVAGGVGIAFPMNRDVQTESDNNPRFYFNVNKEF